jgi:hypothetical protein
MFRNIVRFYGEKLLALHPTPKLEYHPLSAVRDFLFIVFAVPSASGNLSSICNPRARHAVVTGTYIYFQNQTGIRIQEKTNIGNLPEHLKFEIVSSF